MREREIEYDGRSLRSGDYLLFSHTPRRIVVAGDNSRPELLRAACEGAHVLVHEATYTHAIAEKVGSAPGHSSAAATAAFARSARIPNLVLTHFSARYQNDPSRSPSIEDIRAEAASLLLGKLFIAEDFSRLKLARDGSLSRYHPE